MSLFPEFDSQNISQDLANTDELNMGGYAQDVNKWLDKVEKRRLQWNKSHTNQNVESGCSILDVSEEKNTNLNYYVENESLIPTYSIPPDQFSNPLIVKEPLENYDLVKSPECASNDKKTVAKSKRKCQIQDDRLTSYVKRKVLKGHRLIKIEIYDLDNGDTSDSVSELNNLTSVQYVVQDYYDEVMDKTNNLVETIVRKMKCS